jgi:hypothetical protein
MPTGYTLGISKGISFNEYAMGCARAFVALINMRDDNSGAKIPEKFEPSDYHFKALAKSIKKLESIEKMDIEQASIMVKEQFEKDETRRKESLKEKIDLLHKYQLMIKEADKWNPPTDDHKGLKDFMKNQIEESIKFDCDTSYYEKESDKLSADEWILERKASAIRDIEYHKKNTRKKLKEPT